MTLLERKGFRRRILFVQMDKDNNASKKYDSIISGYITNLKNATKIVSKLEVNTWWGKVTLNCFTVDPNEKLPKGFRMATIKWKDKDFKEFIYQYDLRTSNLGRPKAYRVPFLNADECHSENFTVSHLCHQTWCLNPRHHVLESLEDNKGRNGCPGGNHCMHQIKCLIPGPYSKGDTSVAPSSDVNSHFIL